MDNIMILGSGYSGLNAYYRLRRKFNVKIITRDYYLNYYLFNNPVRIKLKDDIINEQVKDVNIEKREIITDKNVYNADKIIIATGCDRNNQITFLEKMKLENNMAIGSQNEFDEYIVINFILAMKKYNKNFKFSGNALSFLGKKIRDGVISLLNHYNITITESPDYILPECKPALFNDFLNTDNKLRIADDVFAIGDAINFGPKIGELAMRMGIFVGDYINGAKNSFDPVYITVLGSPQGPGMRVVSSIPWGGSIEKFRFLRKPAIMKGFLYNYYRIRRGNMGFLKYI
ncbi:MULTISPECIES: FAD/NAD(P)-binding oxidoreductase [Acidiplasma]|jgi:hypothetical protein|uniref:FAD/NAD(P)-binding domain-containing protein n=2 Tax=Acidiplasma TaxID=507753 RepID=A0A0Q0WIZ7_9ARCH|nr:MULTISPECIES: FAD/NAD(P)-binding oxidoreductase [Acidiplasma]KJE48925.1 hypothetical protein TZ01_06540 [Acidiplasma sp. MBA-1]KQB35186.1 hypothetical protein AOG54_03290 [Acidiplasma aeolicum]KQB35614.1 hypothetical protein AOG55_06275 [Acidiplasma cupricumulans]WMT54341.1 MAG: FAD/NAD(P)-binding oxidoreductase [Acidiplasma sp.]